MTRSNNALPFVNCWRTVDCVSPANLLLIICYHSSVPFDVSFFSDNTVYYCCDWQPHDRRRFAEAVDQQADAESIYIRLIRRKQISSAIAFVRRASSAWIRPDSWQRQIYDSIKIFRVHHTGPPFCHVIDALLSTNQTTINHSGSRNSLSPSPPALLSLRASPPLCSFHSQLFVARTLCNC